MKIARKITSIVTIMATAYVVLDLILRLLEFKPIGGMNLFGTIITIAIGGFFAINSLNMITKNKAIGYISLALIILPVTLIIIAIWASLENSLYMKVVVSLGLLSILFNLIVSTGLDLGKSNLVLQVIVYVIVAAIDVIATLAVFGVIDILPILILFICMILLAFLGVIILKVLAKRVVSSRLETEKDMVKISKVEYAELLDKAKKYDEMMARTKENVTE